MNIINLTARLLVRGRELHQMGRSHEAQQNLQRVTTASDADHHTLEEAHLHLAELALDGQRFRRARRHLRIVITLNPANANAYNLLGTAYELDPKGDPKDAARAFRRATRVNPWEASNWCAYAQICTRLGKEKRAVRAFRKAAFLVADNLELLDEILEGLCFLRRTRMANTLLQRVRFRMGPAADNLVNRFKFREVRRKQLRAKHRDRGDSPTVLPFPQSTPSRDTDEPEILRHDGFSQAIPHHRRISG